MAIQVLLHVTDMAIGKSHSVLPFLCLFLSLSVISRGPEHLLHLPLALVWGPVCCFKFNYAHDRQLSPASPTLSVVIKIQCRIDLSALQPLDYPYPPPKLKKLAIKYCIADRNYRHFDQYDS